MTNVILRGSRKRSQLLRKTLAVTTCALLVSATSAWADDGLGKQYEVFSPANGYLPAVAADGGGAGKDAATRGCFAEAIWLDSDGRQHSAEAGKNYFQNGIDTTGNAVWGPAVKHNALNGPDVSSLPAADAAAYLTFPGNKLVLGTGEKNNGLDPMYFYLFNGKTGVGNLADASAKPYRFGGDGLVMAGHCSLYPCNCHGAIAGKLTILSDDHDDYRTKSVGSGTLTCNYERWTMNQCSLIRLKDDANFYSLDIQSDLIGAANAFLGVIRHYTTAGAGTTYHSTCRLSGDNSQFFGTIAVETNCWLQLKTSLASGTVKVGYRGWPEFRSGTAGNAPYDKLVFDPGLNLSGHLVTEANAGALSVGTLENNCGDVTVSAGSTLSVGALAYRGGDFSLMLSATAADCGTLTATTVFEATHRPIRIRLKGTDAPTEKIAVFAVPAAAGLTADDFQVTGTGTETLSVETAVGVTKVLVGGAETVHQSSSRTPGLADGDDYVNTFMFAADCWTPSGVPAAGKRYVNDDGYQVGGPRIYNNGGDIPAAQRTFAGDAYVLGSDYENGLDQNPKLVQLQFFNGWGFDGSGKYDVESRPYVFGQDGLVLKNYAQLFLGRFGAVQGRLTVLGDDAMAYALAGNEDRHWNAVPTVLSSANSSNPWGFAHDGELIGGEQAFLVFHKSAGELCNKVSEIRFNGDTDGYFGRLAVETNCLLRLKNGLKNGGVVVGWRGWPVKGLNWNLPYAPDSDVAGKVLFPAARGALAVGSISNNCGAVTVEAGTTVTVGDFVYDGGIVHLGSTESAAGVLKVADRFVALKTPVRVKFDATVGPSDRTAVLAVPVSSGLTAADFSFSGLGGKMRLLSETKDGFLTFFTVGVKAFPAGTHEVADDYVFEAFGYTFGISPTVGASASLTVNGKMTVDVLPIKLGLTGNGGSMPQGEMVKLISWRTADNPAFDICDFDFSLLGDHDGFGAGGVGRGYPVLKTEGGMTTLCLDCTEVLKTAADTGFSADATCFRNGDKWADGRWPHLDANYFTNGKRSWAPGNLTACEFPDGATVPGREFHGNRIRIGSGTQMTVEKSGREVNFAQEGLVLQQGGKLLFCDPGIVVSGKVHCASLYGAWTGDAAANRTGCENASSVGATSTRFVADFTSDRRADFTVFASSWFGDPSRPNTVGKFFTCTFDGDMSGFLGTLVCENRCCVGLNRGLPNGTVRLGWTGFPFAALGSLDDCTNGWLSASCADRTLSISNLVVNGAKVTVSGGNTYALKALTLNGGTLDVSAFGSTATQLAVDGLVAVTHATKIALTRRPTCRTPLRLISWPTAQSAPDTSLLALVKPDGSSWGAKCALTVETEGDVTYLTARSPDTGAVILFR